MARHVGGRHNRCICCRCLRFPRCERNRGRVGRRDKRCGGGGRRRSLCCEGDRGRVAGHVGSVPQVTEPRQGHHSDNDGKDHRRQGALATALCGPASSLGWAGRDSPRGAAWLLGAAVGPGALRAPGGGIRRPLAPRLRRGRRRRAGLDRGDLGGAALARCQPWERTRHRVAGHPPEDRRGKAHLLRSVHHRVREEAGREVHWGGDQHVEVRERRADPVGHQGRVHDRLAGQWPAEGLSEGPGGLQHQGYRRLQRARPTVGLAPTHLYRRRVGDRGYDHAATLSNGRRRDRRHPRDVQVLHEHPVTPWAQDWQFWRNGARRRRRGRARYRRGCLLTAPETEGHAEGGSRLRTRFT